MSRQRIDFVLNISLENQKHSDFFFYFLKKYRIDCVAYIELCIEKLKWEINLHLIVFAEKSLPALVIGERIQKEYLW